MTSCNIPEDLVIEILKRLPVKTLMRLRCACKTWCMVTSNPNFINMHLKFNHTNVNDDRLIVMHWDEAANTNIFSLFPTELQDELPLTLNLEPRIKAIEDRFIRIIYCHGILCIYNNLSRLISLWNPAIREFKTLPFVPHNLSANEDETVYVSRFGFGFDCEKSSDYKVVVFKSSSNPERLDFHSAQVYSARTNSWRVVNGGIPLIRGPAGGRSPVYTNGFLHWATMAFDYPSVVSFDLGEESFHETPILGLPEEDDCRIDLASLEGGSYYEVWVMKEHGVKESWTRKYIVKFPGKNFFPSGLWKKGELLLHLNGSMYLYDPNTQQTRDLRLQGSDYYMWAFICKESLVLIKDTRPI